MAATLKTTREPQRLGDDDLRVFDISALMSVFALSKPSIYGLIKSGRLRTFMVGRSRRATGRAIRECQEALEVAAAEQDAHGLASNFRKSAGLKANASHSGDVGQLPEPIGGISRHVPRKARRGSAPSVNQPN
ncbi:hypothetical protein QTH87_13440 [Variovorax sp. J22P168]|uniref:hypothetical protein n=1 Tax=Variovorax jilinensis TaxID=3053513 RepID=UPI002575F1A3|nr:hypothetical protein [Variovorax sp. J22P168]MDM0013440.1 hypothetical protein [Variovorax sp. J22P168]